MSSLTSGKPTLRDTTQATPFPHLTSSMKSPRWAVNARVSSPRFLGPYPQRPSFAAHGPQTVTALPNSQVESPPCLNIQKFLLFFLFDISIQPSIPGTIPAVRHISTLKCSLHGRRTQTGRISQTASRTLGSFSLKKTRTNASIMCVPGLGTGSYT